MAAKAALRAFQMSARSASSAAIRIPVAPLRSHTASTSSKRAAHSDSEPSSSMISEAPASRGLPACVAASVAWMANGSMISMAPGTMPAATTSDTLRPAASGDVKYATTVRTASGAGTTRSVISVATPRVPSDPTKAPSRS
jgi:hypothetical protein